ncbi:MAG: UDP-N-acetylmuramate dehydrogenase [Clostridia bacterium]|nr:UDP-N-acetylmuramate dehydrogenase [Clostridia bacterium]
MKVDSLVALSEKLKIKYILNEKMALHTSFKIGGAADIFLCPENKEQLAEILKTAKENGIPCTMLGKGCNLLVSDGGIEGAVITTLSMQQIILVNETVILAEAGATLADVCRFARDNSLTGLEFAYGIPATVGGALYMNAGAYGGDMSMVVKSAASIGKDFTPVYRKTNEMKLGYRQSIYEENGEVITAVVFDLEVGDKARITEDMETIMAKRKKSQPLEYPSAGSTFKRPEGYFAAALIDECGLKGHSVGDAEVSTKHAGFVINKGGATCNDVLSLIEDIKNTVKEKRGVELSTEVIHLGR